MEGFSEAGGGGGARCHIRKGDQSAILSPVKPRRLIPELFAALASLCLGDTKEGISTYRGQTEGLVPGQISRNKAPRLER